MVELIFNQSNGVTTRYKTKLNRNSSLNKRARRQVCVALNRGRLAKAFSYMGKDYLNKKSHFEAIVIDCDGYRITFLKE